MWGFFMSHRFYIADHGVKVVSHQDRITSIHMRNNIKSMCADQITDEK